MVEPIIYKSATNPRNADIQQHVLSTIHHLAQAERLRLCGGPSIQMRLGNLVIDVPKRACMAISPALNQIILQQEEPLRNNVPRRPNRSQCLRSHLRFHLCKHNRPPHFSLKDTDDPQDMLKNVYIYIYHFGLLLGWSAATPQGCLFHIHRLIYLQMNDRTTTFKSMIPALEEIAKLPMDYCLFTTIADTLDWARYNRLYECMPRFDLWVEGHPKIERRWISIRRRCELRRGPNRRPKA